MDYNMSFPNGKFFFVRRDAVAQAVYRQPGVSSFPAATELATLPDLIFPFGGWLVSQPGNPEIFSASRSASSGFCRCTPAVIMASKNMGSQ